MASITVEQQGTGTYHVVVVDQQTTEHTVTVADAYYQELTGGTVTVEALVEKAFEFLMEHEPNTMILSRFDLALISQYFPSFEKDIVGMVSA